MLNMMASPARPMDLDDDDYFHSKTNFQHDHHHHTPLTKMLFSQDYHFHKTPTLFRIVQNPFDPPTSAHLKQRLASPSIFRVLSQNDDNDKVLLLDEFFEL